MRSFVSLIASCAASTALVCAVPIAHAEQKITWEACPETVKEPGTQCGRIDVPMNYSDPYGKKISVGFVKLPAKQQSRGSLFVNPGGPGGSVYDFFITNPMFGKAQWPDDVRNEWDIVAVQPRGLEGSTPLECTPVMDMSVDKISNLGALTKAECDKKNPGYAENVNTENTASDWNEVRRVLGQEKISIFGMSYGTFLGSVYATKFPQHTDKVILDAGYNPDADSSEQLRGFEEAFTDFFTWVAKHDDVYHMGTTPRAVYEKWAERVMAESGASPTVPPPNADDFERVGTDLKGLFTQIASGGGQQSNSQTLQLTMAVVAQPTVWPLGAKLISNPEATVLPEWMQNPGQEENAMPGMVVCNDRKFPILADHLLAALWARVTGDPAGQIHLYASGAMCGGIEPTQPAREISGAELATKPLQIQGTRDPNTPYWNFSKMSDAMQSQVLTVEGPGHVQGLNGNESVNKIIGEYLRTGQVTETRVDGIDPKPE